MEHRVESEGEEHNQTDSQDHRTQLQVTPVDDVEHCTVQGVEWNDTGGGVQGVECRGWSGMTQCRGWSAGGGVE